MNRTAGVTAHASRNDAGPGDTTNIVPSAAARTKLFDNRNQGADYPNKVPNKVTNGDGSLVRTIYNKSTATLEIWLGDQVGFDAGYRTVQIASNGYYELVIGGIPWLGEVWGIWASANGNAMLTELY